MPPQVQNGTPARATKDDVLADLLRIDRGEEVARKTIEDEPKGKPDDPNKYDEHGRAVVDDPVDDVEDDELDEELDEDEDDLEDAEEELDEDADDEIERAPAKRRRRDEDEELDEDEAEDEKPEPKAAKADEKPKDEKPKEDPELERRRRALQQQEKRGREALARDRAQFERDLAEARRKIETEWGPRIAKVTKVEQLAERVNVDATAVLVELGLREENFEEAAKLLYAMSPAGRGKPENREHAARAIQVREQAAATSALKQELAEVKAKLAETAQRDAVQRALDEYHSELATTAKAADAPLVRRVLEKNPNKARNEMQDIARRLLEKHGQPPSAARVVRVYEKQRRRDLEDAGVDVDAIIKAAKPAGGATTTAAKPDDKKPAAVAPAKKGKPKTRDELRDELERELAERDRAS